MRRIIVLGVALAAVMGSVAPAFAQGPLPVDTPIEPLGEIAARYYPDRAQRMEANGWARLRCVPEETGALTDCVVVGEGPEGFRFRDAALKLARLIRVRADVRDSVVGKPSYFKIGFVAPGGRNFENPVRSPRREMIEAARPRGADAIGMVSLSCRTGLSGDGALTDCVVQTAGPAGQGFVEAALGLASSRYRADLVRMPKEVTFWLSTRSFGTGDEEPFAARVQNAQGTFVELKDPAVPVSGAALSEAGIALTCRWQEDGSLQACRTDAAATTAAAASPDQIAATVALADRLRLVRQVSFNINWGQ